MFRAVLCCVFVALTQGQFGPHPPPGECGASWAPATCKPPQAQYSRIAPVQSRQQWTNKDGYCGALSVQSSAMAFGMWISQDQVRRAAGGRDVDGGGLEIYYRNIVPALNKLKLVHDDWDYQREPKPQYKSYFKWLKGHLVQGHPVVWMILTKERAALGSSDGEFSHIEPVWGIYSNRSLSDKTVYDDDVVVHGADYWAKGAVEGSKLYRSFASLPDNPSMQGNCGNVPAKIGLNEFYPCVMYDVDYGYAITGYIEEGGTASVPLSLAVDRFDEPEYPWTSSSAPAQLHGTVTIQGPLDVDATYKILRWDDFRKVPTDGSYLSSNYDHAYDFVPSSANGHVFQDPNTFASSGTTYYRCVKAKTVVV